MQSYRIILLLLAITVGDVAATVRVLNIAYVGSVNILGSGGIYIYTHYSSREHQ